jgi:hypothetical protein
VSYSNIIEGDDDINALTEDGKRLKEFNRKKEKQYMEQIILADNKRLDELHMELLQTLDTNDINDISNIKMVFDFLKSKNK